MKKLAVLLCVLLCMTPFGAMADTGEEMTAAITAVRERVEIPTECTEFSGYKNTYNNRSSWEFSWETPSGAEARKNVRVIIRESGIIESVYMYADSEASGKQGKTLPLISAEAAMETARLACEGFNPSLAASYREGTEAVLSGDSYHVTIPRTEGGIPVYNNSASLRVSILTGTVESYTLSHTETAVFSGIDGAIGTEKAQNAFVNNGYMELWYRPFEDTMRLVYVPGQSESLIDARTGAPFVPKSDAEAYRNTMKEESAMMDAAAGGSASLTPQERQAVEEAAGLISYEEAVEKLKSVAAFGILEEATLESGNTYKTADGEYTLRVSLKMPNEAEYRYTYGELDGKTGEIFTFYSDRNAGEEKATTEETAQKTFDTFCAAYLADYTPKLEAPKITAGKYVATVTAQRQENGVPVYGDSVHVTVTADGLIENYRLSWDKKANFESADGILSEEAAYRVLFEKGAPRLCYYAADGAALLIYAAAEREFAFIAAKDGACLTYSGTAYVERKQEAYADISGHYAEEAILALSSIGATLGDGAFLPDNVITQKEFVGLVSNCVMEYYPIYDGALDEARLYSYAINRGVLPKDEEAPDAPLTREMAAAYLLRAMGYEEFASIPGIFRCDFADAETISPALYGYVAIARGLGIINGMGNGLFEPQRHVTRGEAAVMIYNYLR